jgi:hypothetical protein
MPAPRFIGQCEDLAVSEVDVIAPPWPWQAQAPRGIGPDTAASHRVIERGRHDKHGLANARGTKATQGQPGHPLRQPLEGGRVTKREGRSSAESNALEHRFKHGEERRVGRSLIRARPGKQRAIADRDYSDPQN